jgi:hypothetical protein
MNKIKLRVRWGKNNPGDVMELPEAMYQVAISKGYGVPANAEHTEKLIKISEPKKRRKQ